MPWTGDDAGFIQADLGLVLRAQGAEKVGRRAVSARRRVYVCMHTDLEHPIGFAL